MIVNLIGGTKTASSRTVSLTFYSDTILNTIEIPVTLQDLTTYAKYVVVTVTIGDYVFSERVDWEKEATGSRILSFNIMQSIPSLSTVTIKVAGSRCYVNYDDTVKIYALQGAIICNSGSFEASLSIVMDNTWQLDIDNEGYPNIIGGQSPDISIFAGYNPPKPLNSWKIDSNNDGYPWTWGFAEIVEGEHIFYKKTATGIVPIDIYKKTATGIIPITLKYKEG